jgi:tetratricopeptide (TPR) repeat protein
VYAVSFTASQYLLGQGLVQATRGTVTAEREMLAWSTRLYPVDAQAQDAYMLLTLHSARQIQTYASVHPHAAQTTNDEADAYWQLGDWNTALAYRQEEVDGNPYSEAVDEKLVGEYISASRFSEARSADQRALELLPAGGDANLWILLAKIDAEQGNAKSSRNCLESAYRSDPTNFQLKHVLQRSKSDLSAAVSYALSVES